MSTPIVALAIFLAMLFLEGITDARREQAVEWNCELTIEDAIELTERLPAGCIASPELVAEVLIDMGLGEPDPSKPTAAQQCICPVSCLRAGGCAPGVWDGL